MSARKALESGGADVLISGKDRLLIIGIPHWSTEWWSPKRGSLEKLIATAQWIIRHGLSAESINPVKSDPHPGTDRGSAATGACTKLEPQTCGTGHHLISHETGKD